MGTIGYRSSVYRIGLVEYDAVLIGKLNSTDHLEQYAVSCFRIYTILEFLRLRSGCETLIPTAAGE